jgi:hypothetical protein
MLFLNNIVQNKIPHGCTNCTIGILYPFVPLYNAHCMGFLNNINKKAPSSQMALLFGGSIKRARHEVGDMKDDNIDMGNQTRLCPTPYTMSDAKVMLARSAVFLFKLISSTCDTQRKAL